MLEFLKKIGLPATVAAIIASIITITPFLFKLDERYAKDDEVKAEAARAEAAMNVMNNELMRLAGNQEVVLSILTRQEHRSVAMQRAQAATTRAPAPLYAPINKPSVQPGSAKPTAAVDPAAVKKLEEATKSVQGQQDRLRSFKY